MSENPQDGFEAAAPLDQHNEEAQPIDSTTSRGDEPAAAEEKSSASALPPEAQGEVNGGPLGCCLGVTVGLLLSLSLIILSYVFANPLRGLFQGNDNLLGLLVRILMGLLACALAIFFGVLGWRLGKRFFREYEPPMVKERKRRIRAKKIEQNI
jgi:hypothetical protein